VTSTSSLTVGTLLRELDAARTAQDACFTTSTAVDACAWDFGANGVLKLDLHVRSAWGTSEHVRVGLQACGVQRQHSPSGTLHHTPRGQGATCHTFAFLSYINGPSSSSCVTHWFRPAPYRKGIASAICELTPVASMHYLRSSTWYVVLHSVRRPGLAHSHRQRKKPELRISRIRGRKGGEARQKPTKASRVASTNGLS
jgi:hypothetical protein